MDSETRELERLALQGDTDDFRRLAAIKARLNITVAWYLEIYRFRARKPYFIWQIYQDDEKRHWSLQDVVTWLQTSVPFDIGDRIKARYANMALGTFRISGTSPLFLVTEK